MNEYVLREKIVDAASTGLANFSTEISEKYPEEDFYGFSFYLDSDISSVCTMANSKQSAERTRVKYQKCNGINENTKWTVSEWSYDDKGSDAFEELNKLLAYAYENIGGQYDPHDMNFYKYKLYCYNALSSGIKRYSKTNRKKGLFLSIDEGDAEFLGVARHFYSVFEHNNIFTTFRFSFSYLHGLGIFLLLIGIVTRPISRGFSFG